MRLSPPGARMAVIQGSTTGLKASQIRALERIYRRRVPPERVITAELARYLTELSFELRRQIGLIIDRQGVIQHVILGDDREIVIPDLSRFGLGRSGLRGLRCVHTHLRGEPLSQDDINDLSLLRLDLMVAIGVDAAGLPGPADVAHLLPPNPEGRTCEVQHFADFYRFDLDFAAFVGALDDELERSAEETVDLEDGRERAILVSVSRERRQQVEDSLDELEELARTADVQVLDRVVQRAHKIHP
ncbi:MAG: GTPase HflX, partial [Deltaproteobacteria bacterium]